MRRPSAVVWTASCTTSIPPKWWSQKPRANSSWLPGTKITLLPLRARRRSFCTTSLCAWGQNQRLRNCQPSTISPTRYKYWLGWCFKKSKRASAWHPAVPRCRSDMNTERKRGASSSSGASGMAMAAATKLFTRESIGISWCGVLPFVGHAPVAQGDKRSVLSVDVTEAS